MGKQPRQFDNLNLLKPSCQGKVACHLNKQCLDKKTSGQVSLFCSKLENCFQKEKNILQSPIKAHFKGLSMSAVFTAVEKDSEDIKDT